MSLATKIKTIFLLSMYYLEVKFPLKVEQKFQKSPKTDETIFKNSAAREIDGLRCQTAAETLDQSRKRKSLNPRQ